MTDKAKKSLIVSGTVFLSCGIFLLGFLTGLYSLPHQNPVSANTEITSDTFFRAPEGVTPEMSRPDYWIRPENDTLLFSEQEIIDFNENNPLYVQYTVNGKTKKLFENALDETLEGNVVRSLLESALLNAISDPESGYYVNGARINCDYSERISELINADSVGNTVVLRYAVCVKATVSMQLPSEDFLSTTPDEIHINDAVSAEISPFTGVIVLHESADGEWYYLLAGSFCGWVRKETVALCRDHNEWEKACNPDTFLIVTGDKLVLDETAVPSAVSGMILPMGTKIPLSEEAAALPDGRSAMHCYFAELPIRAEDGTLSYETVPIPISGDVHVGYLTMTSSSVITQAFKFLGHIYGWGGSFSSNDCSGMVRQIYRCYGFRLPRSSAAISSLKDLGSFSCASMTADKKSGVLSRMPAGLLLYMKGHLMIFLGTDNGIPYVISSCASYYPADSKPGKASQVFVNGVMVSGLDLVRENGSSWLDSLTVFTWKEY